MLILVIPAEVFTKKVANDALFLAETTIKIAKSYLNL